MYTNSGTTAQRNKGTGSYFLGGLQCFFGGALVFIFGIIAVGYAFAGDTFGPQLFFIAGVLCGAFLLRRGIQRCKLYQLSQQVQRVMQGKSREQLALLAQVSKRNYTQLVSGLRELSSTKVFPGSYVDLNRKEFVLVPGGPQPPIPYEETVLREKPRRSVAPVYAIAVSWILYALSFPLYRIADFVIATAISVIAAVVVARMMPRQTVIVEERRKAETPTAKPAEKINTGNAELDEVLSTAMGYMNELTALNDAITSPKVKEPLVEMINICKQIFDYIKKTPAKIKQIRQFMNYYLPTTLKLLRNYEELSRQPVKGENINKTMRNIESAMETIRKAFQKELDDLYEDKAMDISVDIEVLENMMEEEGLTSDPMEMVSRDVQRGANSGTGSL